MGEGLREVAELLARRADLLGEQTEVVAVGQRFLECEACLVEAPGTGQRVDVPQPVQREKVPSDPGRPSGDALGSYR